MDRLRWCDAPNVADGSVVTINLTANNVSDNNTAFSLQDALITATRYVTQVSGAPARAINVVFPTNRETSLFDGTALQVLQLDRFDHDVIDHEFGHYIQRVFNIENSPGGSHSSSENLAETRGKSDGLLLAWGEGWPTYFAITLQIAMGADEEDIPNVGDTYYTDTEDSTLDYSLETAFGGQSLGEDNELSIQRILFDLYDSAADIGDQRGVSLGDQVLWDLVTDSESWILNEFYDALVVGESLQRTADYGCVFGTHKVAPVITAPPTNGSATSTPPTIRWNRNGLGPSFRNNSSTVTFYNSDSDAVLFTSNTLAGASFRPTQAQWNAILADPGTAIQVVVNGGNTASPVTGPYTSCNITLTQP